MAGFQQYGHHQPRISEYSGDKEQTLDWIDEVDAAAETMNWDTFTAARTAKQSFKKNLYAKKFYDNTVHKAGFNLNVWTPVLAVTHVPYVAAVAQIMADPHAAPPVLAVAHRAGVVEVPAVAAIPGGLKAAMLAFFGKKKTYEVLVTAMFALKQGTAEPADMFMQRVETVMHDLDVKMID
jgi:hypothetical protein